MVDELPRAITTASGLISLAIGVYVFLRGRRQTVNNIVFLISVFMAVWALGEAMTMTASDLGGKIFWTRVQGIGEMLLMPTYLLLALHFPRARGFMLDRKKATATVAVLYAPWLLGLLLLFTTGAIYSSYFLVDVGQGVNVVRTPFFWFLTALGFAIISASMAIFLYERSRNSSKVARKGLFILAMAPVPMMVANVIQNFEISHYITTPQSSLIFVCMLAYGILRYGLFIDIRSVTRNMLTHAVVMAVNLAVFTLLCAFYAYGLDLGFGWIAYLMFVLTGLPFMVGYHAELRLARRLTGRYIYGREFEEGRLLQELAHSIRTVSNLDELAASVVEEVRKSMNLGSCALMMVEDGGYRMVGYSACRDHIAYHFRDCVEEGVHVLEWDDSYTTYCESNRFSTYWLVGNRVNRGLCELEFLRLGSLRTYEGGGVVREMHWRDEEGGAILIPLEVHGERTGLLWLGGRLDQAPFTMDELDFMVALSTQVAVSLLNSKLMQELLDKSARLQELIQDTSKAQEEERIRISRELHDGLAPYFLDFIFRLEMLEAQLAYFPVLTDSLEGLKEKAREGLRDLRQVIGDLRPSALDVLGLEKSLSTYLERFAAENGLAVEFITRGSLERLDSLTEVTIFRVAQEALSNIARHAGAASVKFMLKGGDGWVEMAIEDDGAGFIEREVREKIVTGECLGIKGMRERAELMQGDLVIDTRPGDGTKVSFSFPVPQKK
ncbi:MAG: histidine kinase N-terminal 7TM domain-containing protein [Actinomycetota bacterium]|nr:histidine kinase N-terminal 7TM domain-containing protein [Actinomycetota bacterium]MDD5666197.1 histidine kinase N-terminal 7TM domain-containing protein [Actinomycetota bacterium]